MTMGSGGLMKPSSTYQWSAAIEWTHPHSISFFYAHQRILHVDTDVDANVATGRTGRSVGLPDFAIQVELTSFVPCSTMTWLIVIWLLRMSRTVIVHQWGWVGVGGAIVFLVYYSGELLDLVRGGGWRWRRGLRGDGFHWFTSIALFPAVATSAVLSSTLQTSSTACTQAHVLRSISTRNERHKCAIIIAIITGITSICEKRRWHLQISFANIIYKQGCLSVVGYRRFISYW